MVELQIAAGAAVAALVVGVIVGYLVGSRSGGDGEASAAGVSDLQPAAELLERPPEPAEVADGVGTLVDAVDAVAAEAGLEADGQMRAGAPPVERAAALKQAADGGRLTGDDGGSGEGVGDAGRRTEPEPEPVETTPAALTGAAATVRSRAPPETEDGRRLLEYLETADETDERRLVDTLTSVVTALNRHERLREALSAVQPGVEAREMAETLRSRSQAVDGEASEALTGVARRLVDTADRLDDCESARADLESDVDRICAAVREETSVSLGAGAATAESAALLAKHLQDGALVVGDRESSVGAVAGDIEDEVAPESRLAGEFVDVLTGGAREREAIEETLRDVVTAVDAAETTRHRLDGVDAGDVELLAERVVEEFRTADAPGSGALRDRAADLKATVEQASDSDLVTVYAARQELRFYDRQLLATLRDATDAGDQETEVAALWDDVEQRRSHMRTDYPSDYPQHDHSIPIHFLELVSALQESAEEARAGGNDERAVGYLLAADRALDWIAELYERNAYNVLLEQLRS